MPGLVPGDYVSELLAEAERCAEAVGLNLRTQVADAQALRSSDGEFDVVMSTIGAMFAPDQQAVGQEMLRVCRAGRTLAVDVAYLKIVVGSRV